MAPSVESFPPWELEARVNITADGKLSKQPVDIRRCLLKELIQYNCDLAGPKDNPRSKVICEPLVRLFRQCANGLTVETTSWEGVYDERK